MKNCKLHFFWPQKSRGGGGGKNVTMDVGHGNLHFSTPPKKKTLYVLCCAVIQYASSSMMQDHGIPWYTKACHGLSIYPLPLILVLNYGPSLPLTTNISGSFFNIRGYFLLGNQSRTHVINHTYIIFFDFIII